MTPIEKVNEFMIVMGQEVPDKPSIPSKMIQALRWGLINEENAELATAADAKDLLEIADALCDLRYVVEGAFIAYGFSPQLAEELFTEVHQSNMSKVCHTQEEAEKTIDKLVSDDTQNSGEFLENGESVSEQYSMKQVGEYWIVSRVSDNKVMKSVNFYKPNLTPILQKHGVLI
jgi:predicted HAD superfamily Cof-like phosphohydrolase